MNIPLSINFHGKTWLALAGTVVLVVALGALAQGVRGERGERGEPRAVAAQTPELDLDAALAAYKRDDYVPGLRAVHRLAEANDPRAQYELASIYDYGPGPEQDPTEAARLYELAAEQGQVDAQLRLALMYQFGHGVARDAAEASKWLHRAAVQGDPEAQMLLGIHYAEGRRVPRDAVRAYGWFEMAARGGHPAARQQQRLLRQGMPERQLAGIRLLVFATELHEARRWVGLLSEATRRLERSRPVGGDAVD